MDGGSECENITQDYNTEIVLPDPTKTGYTFDCWCSDPELSKEYTETTMPAGNVTLYSKWSINQYNLTIVFNNGAENEVRTLDFNEKIIYPENVEKTGYTFNGWDKEPDRMPAENIIITAQWIENKEPSKPSKPTEYVEIVFGKDFTEEYVRDILDDYTKEGFTIVEFERDEKSGEIRIVISFVKNIRGSSDSPAAFIKAVDCIPESALSFSFFAAPCLMILSLISGLWM